MDRRCFLGIAFALWPVAGGALAQQPRPSPGAQHDLMLGQEFDALPPGARDRVGAAFREGSPGLDDAAVRQRWNAMTPGQRGETLTARERAQHRNMRGPGPGAGQAQGPRRQEPGRQEPGRQGWGGPGPGPRGAGPQPQRGAPP